MCIRDSPLFFLSHHHLLIFHKNKTYTTPLGTHTTATTHYTSCGVLHATTRATTLLLLPHPRLVARFDSTFVRPTRVARAIPSACFSSSSFLPPLLPRQLHTPLFQQTRRNMSTVIAMSWQEHIEPVEFSAVASAAHRVFSSPTQTNNPAKVYLLSENQTSILANVPCVSSLEQIAQSDDNDKIEQVVIVGSLTDCTQQVRDLIKQAANNGGRKLIVKVVDTLAQYEHSKGDSLLDYPNIVVDKEMIQSAASRCSILVNRLREQQHTLLNQRPLEEFEIRYYLMKIFFDVCRNPNEIGMSDFESGSFLRYLCSDLNAAFLPFDRVDDLSSSYPPPPPLASSLTTNEPSGSSESANKTKVFKIDTSQGGNASDVHIEPQEIVQRIQKLHKPAVLEFLKVAGEQAAKLGYDAYIAGGFVRDLLLGRLNQDIDIVVVGDGIAFADSLLKGKIATDVTHHREFGTAVVKLNDYYVNNGVCAKVDVATTRQEKYPKPAVLPEVQPSYSMWYDMERRDFTFNAMGIRITPSHFGSIIDLVGGQEDLLITKSLRVLHPWSFVDDPTRLFRAIRFEQRMRTEGYSIGNLTSIVFQKSALLGFANRLSGSRISRELQLILSENAATSSVLRLEEFKLLSSSLHSSFTTIPESALRRADRSLEFWNGKFDNHSIPAWHIRFLALCSSLTTEEFEVVVKKLHLSEPVVKGFSVLRAFPPKFIEWFNTHDKNPLPSKTYDMLNSMSPEGIVYLWAELENEPSGRRCVESFVSTLRAKKLSINGNDLKKLGVPPGKMYAKLLKMTLDALLDGIVAADKDSQVQWVSSKWREDPESHSASLATK
eukprot:TRINITY_DN1576_c0_g1_i1.p1 TRINITY_DN1576_c0_g1~~TRINITY_DN1576_c0_g1_i1.p1  ORF type:complete len:830 (+),score=132.39 TRINITY_DN1576_c0_g1_i1:41-2530(+)